MMRLFLWAGISVDGLLGFGVHVLVGVILMLISKYYM